MRGRVILCFFRRLGFFGSISRLVGSLFCSYLFSRLFVLCIVRYRLTGLVNRQNVILKFGLHALKLGFVRCGFLKGIDRRLVGTLHCFLLLGNVSRGGITRVLGGCGLLGFIFLEAHGHRGRHAHPPLTAA